MACPNCSAWLVEHRFRGILVCHHCGHEERRPETCPSCGAEESLVAFGPGVERLQEEVLERFPDGAHAGPVERHARRHAAASARSSRRSRGARSDIVIGTQLVAKGHNFPGLTLVGVVDADLGLAHGDPRAAERTFQLLTQVTGRAGRAGQASRGLIQTYSPEHPVMQALVSGDREAFYATRDRDAPARRTCRPSAGSPSIIVSAGDRPHGAGACARHGDGGAAGGGGAPARPGGGAASRCCAAATASACSRSPTTAGRLHDWLRAWLAKAPKERGSVRVAIDVDPMSFL